MEAELCKGTFVSGTIVISLTDPPKLAKREGDPPVTVDEPRPESVTYGLMLGSQWEAGSGVLSTRHDKKRTDGTRLVRETLSRGSVLRSSNDGKRLTIDEGGEVELMIVRGDETLTHKLQVIENAVQLALPRPQPVEAVIPPAAETEPEADQTATPPDEASTASAVTE